MKPRRPPVDWDAFSARKAYRYGIIGRAMEERVESVLSASGIDAIRHLPHSAEDDDGRDFTVRVGDQERSFGVTISHRHFAEHRMKHPDVPQLLLPLSIKDGTIVSKVRKLFEGDEA